MAFRRGKICHYCDASATALDHIVPIYLGGLDVEDNWAAACMACNQAKGAQWPTCECDGCRQAIESCFMGNGTEIGERLAEEAERAAFRISEYQRYLGPLRQKQERMEVARASLSAYISRANGVDATAVYH